MKFVDSLTLNPAYHSQKSHDFQHEQTFLKTIVAVREKQGIFWKFLLQSLNIEAQQKNVLSNKLVNMHEL